MSVWDSRPEEICRECDYHVGGPIAGSSVRWVTCERCKADPGWWHVKRPWWRRLFERVVS